jgi:aspartyl-tRNA(Asn)/glutamyl-tRNA(Gln) amidotransferase subunit C
MPRISRTDVARIAELARLSLSDAESDRLVAELDTILGYVETLSEVATEGVEPTAHVIPLPTPLREDRASPPMDPEVAVANAPDRHGSAFVVPKVIEGQEEG